MSTELSDPRCDKNIIERSCLTGFGNNYLMVVLVPGYRLSDRHFAIESAFASHLRMLRKKLGTRFKQIVVASPELDSATFQLVKKNLAIIDERVEHIRFSPMYSSNLGRLQYLNSMPSICRALYKEVKAADVIHAGPSQLFRPFEFLSLVMGWWFGKHTVSHTDIDNRRSAEMNLIAGKFSRRQYWTTRIFHNSAIHLQHAFCARACSLVLLKGSKFSADYSRRNASNVRNFLDSAFSEVDIISPSQLDFKLAKLKDPATPIDIAYFGRLVDYKGVDDMLRAIAHAKAKGLVHFRFHIIGDGSARQRLEALAMELGLLRDVTFHGAVQFGKPLFDELHKFHIHLAAPLSEDTPRSALDAMASGQAILAYETYYYAELKTNSGAVRTVGWRDYSALGEIILEMSNDRSALTEMIQRGVAFAADNTQEIWLDRRIGWTLNMLPSSKNPE